MWEALAFSFLVLTALILGLYLGWTARDKVAVRDGEKPLNLIQPPVADPIELEVFRPLMTDPENEEV